MTKSFSDFRQYYIWLTELIDLNTEEHEVYSMLIRNLYKKNFYPITDGDENRVEDGIELRELYCDETACDGFTYRHTNDSPCTMLEMMIALAIRIDHDILGMGVPHWFWLMVDNLGLSKLTDDEMMEDGWMEFEVICDRFLNKTYKKNGVGGLFPLPGSKKNIKRLEIWQQMHDYINVMYPV